MRFVTGTTCPSSRSPVTTSVGTFTDRQSASKFCPSASCARRPCDADSRGLARHAMRRRARGQPGSRVRIHRSQLSQAAPNCAEREQRARQSIQPLYISGLAWIKPPRDRAWRRGSTPNAVAAHRGVAPRNEAPNDHTAQDGIRDSRCIEHRRGDARTLRVRIASNVVPTPGSPGSDAVMTRHSGPVHRQTAPSIPPAWIPGRALTEFPFHIDLNFCTSCRI